MDEHGKDYTVKLGKTAGQYNSDANDYVAPGELTVTITLHEYRELVTAAAEKEKLEAIHRRIEADKKVEELEGKIKALAAKLADSLEV